MEQYLRLLNYKDEPKEFYIPDYEKAQHLLFQIKSGDGILTVIYENGIKTYDSDNGKRIHGFDDGLWVLSPKDIDKINNMKDHYDTNELYECELEQGE